LEDVRIAKGTPGPARQQQLFREVNTRIRGVAAGNGFSDDELEILCECGAAGCVSTVQLMVPEYERIRRDDALFVVRPGHETGMTTERTGRYVVVTAPPGS
jgi:hypothetical protein